MLVGACIAASFVPFCFPSLFFVLLLAVVAALVDKVVAELEAQGMSASARASVALIPVPGYPWRIRYELRGRPAMW